MTQKILIVDDEPHIRLLLAQTLEELEDEDVEILTAENGEEGLAEIQAEHPNLVFLDVMMPKMNGFDVCHAVKNELKLSDIFVIMLTAKGQEFDRQRGQAVGADVYMTKPFDPDEVMAKAREVLQLSS
ncbi:MAG TPA: response regulator [Cyanobacteria bacterium UBA8156]|jgi:DNA-binding response OmpR family regulator|nr:response regulator [Cyanobacteria bacterium UBA8156]